MNRWMAEALGALGVVAVVAAVAVATQPVGGEAPGSTQPAPSTTVVSVPLGTPSGTPVPMRAPASVGAGRPQTTSTVCSPPTVVAGQTRFLCVSAVQDAAPPGGPAASPATVVSGAAVSPAPAASAVPRPALSATP